MKTSYFSYPIFQIYTKPFSPLPTTFTPTALFVTLFHWLNGWFHHNWCVILLNDIMDLHMFSLGTIVPEGPCCVFYATKHRVYWCLTHNVVCTSTLIGYHTHKIWFFSSTLIWYLTLKNTQHTQGLTDWHTHINIYQHHLLCAHSSCVYFIEWIISWYKNLLYRIPQCLCFLKITH